MDNREGIKFTLIMFGLSTLIVLTMVIIAYNDIGGYKFVLQSEFTVEDKIIESTSTPMIVLNTAMISNDTDYIVKVHNETYGEFKVNDTELYNNINVGDNCSLKVYKNDKGNIQVRY